MPLIPDAPRTASLKTRAFQILTWGVILVLPVMSWAFDLLMVDSQDSEPYTSLRSEVVTHLAMMGYSPAHNLHIQYWSLGNARGRAQRVWAIEKDKSYDVIFLNGTVAAQAFKEFAYGDSRYTVIFGAVTDPVGLGLITDFDHSPPANFTGICYPIKVEKRLGFIQACMPGARNIGMVYADMPQSRSYVQWIKKALENHAFSHLKFYFRKVPFVQTEQGHLRMTLMAQKYIQELDPDVDVFLSPNDQLGIQHAYTQMVWQTASKPLVSLSGEEVKDGCGATMAIYPDIKQAGKRLAWMIAQVFEGQSIQTIKPEWPRAAYAFDVNKLDHFNIQVPRALLELQEQP